MAKVLEFYNPYKDINNGKPVRTSNYVVKTLDTTRGKRKQAVGTVKGKKFYRFVAKDFRK